MVKEIRIGADVELNKRLNVLREYHGINNNADMVRFLISSEYHRLLDLNDFKPKQQSNITNH
jgi:hypothetical protein